VFQNTFDIHITIIKSFLKGKKSLAAIFGYAKTTKILKDAFLKIEN
jgi:hypothetical protein